MPRKFAIQKKDLEQYGYTQNYGGCYSTNNNKTHKSNSGECRDRIMKHLEADDVESRRVIDHRERENRWLEKQVELADIEDKKKKGLESVKHTIDTNKMDGVNEPNGPGLEEVLR